MKTLRVGVFGSGFMAGVHCSNLRKLNDIEIVAICNVSRQPEDFMREHSIPNYYKDFNQMIDNEELDLVVVSIPPFAHNGQVEYAASKGVNVFLEKPIAINTERGRSMMEAIKNASVKSAVGYQMRFGAAVQKLIKMIKSGEAGKVTLFDARYECNSLHTEWWRDITKSGGQLFEQVIHLYDMAMFFAGKVNSVVAHTANICHRDIEDYTVEDTSAALLTFENGGLGSICASNNAVPMEWKGLFTVVCENVTAYFTDPNNAVFVYTKNENPIKEDFKGDADPYYEEMKAFIEQIRGEDNPYLPDICAGYAGVEVVELATKSKGNKMIPGGQE